MNDARPGRPNQKMRTRKDLLQAAARLMKEGRKPSLEEVAESAMVSRATAYRYFASADALLVEAAVDVEVPGADALFRGVESADAAHRVERVDTLLHDIVLDNEVPIRMILANSMERAIRGEQDGTLPLRQNRRTPLIEAALEPQRRQFTPAMRKMLAQALALIIGTEGMVVIKDVLRLDDAEARKLKRWAIRALVDAARKPG
ncbi:MAG: TetR/AcrR family transcriptional regulator [Burkholderiaceae bacterium]|nr:TetR/AcrR family transcriptional regulator [Burkholderiaceae bacterium]